MAGPAARITIDPLDGRRSRCRRRGQTARSPEQDASDRLAPTRNVTRRGGRGRGRADAENEGAGGALGVGPPPAPGRQRTPSPRPPPPPPAPPPSPRASV